MSLDLLAVPILSVESLMPDVRLAGQSPAAWTGLGLNHA